MNKSNLMLVARNSDRAQHLLKQMGIPDISYSTNAMGAFEEIKINKYKVILCEFELENMNGLQLCKASKQAGFEGMFVLIFKDPIATMPEQMQTTIKASADYYLEGTLNPQGLLKILESAIQESAG